MIPQCSRRLPLLVFALTALLATSCLTPPPGEALMNPAPFDVPEDLLPLLSELQSILPTASAGLAIASVEGDTASIVFVGNADFGEETFFEFGSITKVLTAILFVQAAEEGLVRLDASVNEYLPPEARGDQWEAVTLADLATHSAGIPPHPSNFGPLRLFLSGRARNPFSAYDTEMLLNGIRRAKVEPEGAYWEYSNFGYAILGDVLVRATGSPYPVLVSNRIFEPLSMETATVDRWGGEAVAAPLTRRGFSATNWTFRAFAPAGALRGTILDGLALLEASMLACSTDDSLARANCFAQQPTGVRVGAASEMGLGWVRTERSDATAVWHNGGTGGYSTFLGFSPERERGIVALSNVGRFREIDARLIDWLLEAEG